MTAVQSNGGVPTAGGTQHVPKSLSSLFNNKTYKEVCQRCGERVYAVEKVGPVNGVIFHRQCFKCHTCSQHLTLRTYFTNPEDLADKEIYCKNHNPVSVAKGLDGKALGIRHAMGGGPHANKYTPGQAPRIGADAMYIKHQVNAQNELRRKYQQTYSRHHYPAYLVSNSLN